MDSPKASLAPRDIFRILFRHRRKSAIVFVATIVLTIAGYLVCPRSYVSEAKLFVKIGRESVALDPTATVGATPDPQLPSLAGSLHVVRRALTNRTIAAGSGRCAES